MIDLGQCEITGVFGPMASGKTYLIGQWLKNQNRYVRFDATGETCEDAGVEHIWQSPSLLYERLKRNPYYFRLAYHPGPELEEDFNWCLKVLWRQDVYKLMVVDEFHEVCPVSETPKYVRTMLRYARHDRMGVIGASQRLADVHKLFTAGCRLIILYWTQEARDLDAVQDRWGRECADAVANLRPLLYNDETKVTKQIPQCVVIPRGQKFRVFDFAKDAYVMGNGASDTGTQGEDESASSSSVSPEQPTGGDAGRDEESEDASQP